MDTKQKPVIVLGIDIAHGKDITTFVIYDNVTEEILYMGSDPDEIRKYKIDSVQIDEQDLKLWARI